MTLFRLTKPADYLIIFLFLIISAGFLLFRIDHSNHSLYAEIKTADEEYWYSLDEDRIVSLKEGNFTVQISNQQVRVIESDCLKQICVRRGWISQSGETVICVPNQIIIQIKSEDGRKRGSIDAVTE